MKDLKFSLPLLYGLPLSAQRLLDVLSFTKEQFNIDLPLDNIYGSPSTIWNGARPIQDDLLVDFGYLKSVKEVCNIFFTFSNHKAGDFLDDEQGNLALKYLSEITDGNDGVIVSSIELADYIRETYPKLKLKLSLLKVTMDMPAERTAEYYNSMLEKYDIVVLHCDDNMNFELLKQIKDIDRIEALIDERCPIGCKVRDVHYKLINELNTYGESEKLEQKFNHMWAQCPRSFMNYSTDTLINTKSEVQLMYNIGIRHFKTSGRGTPDGEISSITKLFTIPIDNEKIVESITYFGSHAQ